MFPYLQVEERCHLPNWLLFHHHHHIVGEAGGRFTSLEGFDGPLGADALGTNGKLHDQVLGFVGTLPDEEPAPRRSGRVHDLSAHRQRLNPPDLSPDDEA